MVLNEQNVKMLKSLTQVNQSMYLKKDVLDICDDSKSFFAWAKIDLGLEKEFAIYNVNELLGIFSLHKSPVITENDTHLLITGDGNNIYKYNNKTTIVYPPSKDVILGKIGDAVVTFKMTKDVLNMIKNQASMTKAPNILFDGDRISTTDIENSSFNDWWYPLSGVDMPRITIKSDYINKMYVEDDITVKIYKKGVVFETGDITYLIVSLND